MALSGVTSKRETSTTKSSTLKKGAPKAPKSLTPGALHAKAKKNKNEPGKTDKVEINPSLSRLNESESNAKEISSKIPGTQKAEPPKTNSGKKASASKAKSTPPPKQPKSTSNPTKAPEQSKPKATPKETHKAVAEVRKELEEHKDTGWLGNRWNSIKETIGSSPDPEKSWARPKNLWAKVVNYDHSYEANEKKVAELEARLAENPDAKVEAEELEATKASIETFAKAQDNAVDTITDIGVGVVVGAAVLAAVPTGGASLGFVAGAALIAAPASAAAKVTIKATNDWSAGNEYSRKRTYL